MTKISTKTRERVRRRAGNRCEYCQSHQDDTMGWLEIDHIIPRGRGGSNNEDNLCLSCDFCNQHKWAKVDGIDPLSKHRVHLFNPRKQLWKEHFAWSEDGAILVGLTAVGRATVATLQMNDPLAVTVRRKWVRAGYHPPKN